MTDVDAEFFDLFREEANERLDSFVAALLALEEGRAAPDAIDSLFRDAHTIKGGAGMLGLADVHGLAHAVEDALADVRAAGAFPPELTEPLLRAADALRRLVSGEGGAEPDLLEELARDRAALAAAVRPQEPPPPAEPPSPAGDPAAFRRPIRVPAEKLDRLLDVVGETLLHRRRLEHALSQGRGDDERLEDELGHGELLLTELQDAAVGMRTLPLSSITGPFPRAVRDLAAAEGKHVDLVIEGASTELDRVILESLAEPIVHLLRNAVAHGIEPAEERRRAGKRERARVELRAEQRGALVAVTVADDGRGVAAETLARAEQEGSLVAVLTRAGFSTAEEVSGLAGRGVGLDAVKRYAESLGGTLEIASTPGRGTAVTLALPLTLALLDVLLLERGGNVYGLPLASVEEAVVAGSRLSLAGSAALELRGRSLPLADLASLLGASAPAAAAGAPAVVFRASGRRLAFICDRLIGDEEVVVKQLGPLLARVRGYLGAAILGDGRVALLLDPTQLVRGRAGTAAAPSLSGGPGRQAKVLVVEDSFSVRQLQRSILEAAGYAVETARDGRDALARLESDEEIDLVVADVQMPELDGVELTKAIRRSQRHALLPVVIVTSRGEDEDRRRGIEAGADAYMVKSAYDQGALLETVARLIGR